MPSIQQMRMGPTSAHKCALWIGVRVMPQESTIMIVRLLAAWIVLATAMPAFAQATATADRSDAQERREGDQPVAFEDQVVVSASRTEQELVNAPATITLIPS